MEPVFWISVMMEKNYKFRETTQLKRKIYTEYELKFD